MVPYLTLGVGIVSLIVLLFLAWVLAAPTQEETEYVMGFRMPTQEEPEDVC